MGLNRVNIMVDDGLWKWAKEFGAKDERSGSYVVNRAIELYKAKHEPKKKVKVKKEVVNAVMWIPLNTGEHPVTKDDINQLGQIYPNVDVELELRAMVGWCDANPSKRKTNAGIKRFINSWLKRCQDRGGKSGFDKSTASYNNVMEWVNE